MELVTPQPLTHDSAFVRRVYLDTVGRIPTAAETRKFLADADPMKREKLIDTLMASDGYVSHWFNYWADLLRVNTETAPGGSRLAQEAYLRYVRDSLRENKPYTTLVRELLTTEGKVWDSAANGYYLRDPGMPLDNLSNTVQVFLGTRIVCAQCHDHPFDKWTQMDYFKMAAFTYGVKTNVRPSFYETLKDALRERARHDAEEEMAGKEKETPPQTLAPAEVQPVTTAATPSDPKEADRIRRQQEKQKSEADRKRQERLRSNAANRFRAMDRKYQRAFQPIQNLVRTVETKNSAELPKLPHDYQYADAKPGTVIHPASMFGPGVSLEGSGSPVQAFADWMTSPENPRFTTVITNRLFKEVMGRGLIEPVDEFLDTTQASHPEVQSALDATMKACGYDVKRFLKVLLNTDLYQRAAWTQEVDAGTRYHFAGPVLRRMSAEQTWDSLLTLITPELDLPDPKREQRFAFELTRTRLLIESLGKLSKEDLMNLADELIQETDRNAGELQAVQTELVSARAARDKVKMSDLGQKANKLRSELEKLTLKKIGDKTGVSFAEEAVREAAGPMVQAEMAEFADTANPAMEPPPMTPEQRAELKKQRKAGKGDKAALKLAQSGYFRAAYLPSPAPRGHFLREFGQSDREIIENASDEATVPQALTLLNGQFFAAVVNGSSVLAKDVFPQETPERQIEAIYLALLSRTPTDGESATLLQVLNERGPQEGLKDIIHAVLNGRQFLYIQ